MNLKMNQPKSPTFLAKPAKVNLSCKSKPFSKSIRGFTLIELLVVIGIIGILVIMVVQALSDSKSTSIEAQVRASLKSLNQAQTRAVLIGDDNRPNAADSVWVDNPENAVQWYIDEGYIVLPNFDENILNYIEIRPLTLAEQAAEFDGSSIWKRKP